MSLTSSWFFGLMVTAVIGVFVALVRWWPRWAGPGRRATLTRAALLAGVNLLVLLTAAVSVNNQFGFFADWADLGGAIGVSWNPAASTTHLGGDARSAASQPSGQRSAQRAVLPGLPAQIRPGARLARFTVQGPRSGVRADVVVVLPVGYTDPARRNRRYPVLEAFPGYPGGPFYPSGAVTEAVRRHKLADPVIISPVVQIPAGRDTECVDGGASDPQVETWLTRDVPDWAERTLRVRTDRSSWATIGWSAGGWCAAMATMLHPDRYSAGIVLGGYFRPDFGPLYRPFAPGSPQARRYDLVTLAAHQPPRVALWVQTSQGDTLSYPTSSQFLLRARSPLSVQALVMKHAGHRVEVWQALLPQALTWLGNTAPGFTTSAGSAGATLQAMSEFPTPRTTSQGPRTPERLRAPQQLRAPRPGESATPTPTTTHLGHLPTTTAGPARAGARPGQTP
jgi:enterochelin esterase-like enzyme